MGDVLVIVSAPVFRKARTADGAPLGLRRTWPTDRYVSTHEVLQARLTGDLYLVTVTEGRLWLVAVLLRPHHDGAAWVSEPNVQPIVDLTPWAADLRFDTGNGLDATKMAASLQRPRGLTDSDTALLRHAIAAGAADRATPADLERTVVQVTAAILGRTEEEVRTDPGRYAVLQWDDGFAEDGLDEIDWSTLTVPPLPAHDLYGRRDFDLGKSEFHSDRFQADATTDRSLRELFRLQDGYLYGEQLAALISEGRLKADELDCWEVQGRIAGGETLVQAMTALFLLGDFDDHRLEPGEYNEISPRWADLLDQVQPPGLRAHLSFFFQSADAARCTGAWFEAADDGDLEDNEDEDDDDDDDDDDDGYEQVAAWSIGEGQGQCRLVRLVDDRVPPVPPFAGHSLIRRAPPPEGSRPPESGRSDEITPVALHPFVQRLFPGTTDSDLPAALTRMRKRDPALYEVFERVAWLIQDGEARAALALVRACAEVVQPKHAVVVEYHRCWALFTLHCWPEALASAERTLALWVVDSQIPESFVHNNLAWCALHVGELERAQTHADRAVSLDPENDRAQATRADVLFARGQHKAAFKLLERLMRSGMDPEPSAAVNAHPTYRTLALRYRTPVALTDEEAAELEREVGGSLRSP